MAGVTPVTVNPSSSQYIAPTLPSGVASQAFYFGGNPNVAAGISALAGNKALLYGALAVAALYVFLRFRR